MVCVPCARPLALNTACEVTLPLGLSVTPEGLPTTKPSTKKSKTPVGGVLWLPLIVAVNVTVLPSAAGDGAVYVLRSDR